MSADDARRRPQEAGALSEQVHIWWTPTSSEIDSASRRQFQAWLSQEETVRFQRYLREQDRTLFLWAHALLRHSLSQYAEVEPGAWRFTSGEHGRPELSPVHRPLGLRFNLTHAPGLVACAITEGMDVGIDVERTDRTSDPLKLAARVFSARECEELESLSPAARNARFYEIWTLKEAYGKARGRGITLPMDHLTFSVDPTRGVTVEFDASHPEEARDWDFLLWRPSDRHQGALALRRGSLAERRVVFRRGLALATGGS